ncbi:DUF5666 domain-containing protein [Marinobacter halotolerans]|uniref:DUF5666 domain-containing protein n=1 Tax=Marinobacter halotolerans TaxID=1569211 RepID=UPI0012477E5A|nr:DUF5666 domain-containing protein [Marinobacter halotolerans]
MKPKSLLSAARLSLSALSVGLLSACGGEAGGNFQVVDGGIRGTGSSVGPVSGFGSVFVNGIRFSTDGILNRAVNSDDGIFNEGDLDEGMILRVNGEWRQNGEGTASELEYDDTLRGPISVIEAWNEASQTAVISILGLNVNIDRQTVIKGKPVTDFTDNDVVRVSGWRLPNGDFRASLVRVQEGVARAPDPENEIELEGAIRNFIVAPCSFEIGTVTVQCDQSVQFENFNRADLADGVFVEVEGRLLVGGQFAAEEIRQDDRRRYRRATEDDIQFTGPVIDAFDGSSFTINGITVNVTSDTEFDDGLAPSDLVPGLLIEVEGDYQPDGSVNADEIELREANAEVDGPIEGAVDRQAGTFRVGGVLAQITPLTILEDDDDGFQTSREMLLDALGNGLDVKVEGIEREENGNIFLEAVKIEIDDEQDALLSFELEGKLREIDLANESISVLGVLIQAPSTAYDDTTPAELSGLIDPGQNQYPVVEVEYESVSGVGVQYRASEIELEDEGDN